MNEKESEYKIIEEALFDVIKELIDLITEMALHIKDNYKRTNIHPFRELCLGYLLICKTNLEATLLLIKNNIIHQINFISRNMFEMVLTLYYMDDDIYKKDERVNRYFEYNDSVMRFKARKIIHNYPEIFSGIKTDLVNGDIDMKYAQFKEKYKAEGGKKLDENTWSGKKMSAMIESITDNDIKQKLEDKYKIVVAMNNRYLHPTRNFIRYAIRDFYTHEIKYSFRIMHIGTILFLSDMIIDKFLSEYQRGRPAFRKRQSAIRKIVEELLLKIEEMKKGEQIEDRLLHKTFKKGEDV